MKLPFISQISERIKSAERPPFEGFYIYALIFFLAYLVGDLSTLYMRQYMLPTTPPPKKRMSGPMRMAQQHRFSDVVPKNIFNADHKIPMSIAELEGETEGTDGEPVESNLPLTLVGTIVHSNPSRSIATVLIRGQNKVEPFKIGESIENLADLKTIEREKIIFINKRTRALEYIIVPKDEKIVISTANTAPEPKQEVKTNFNFTRAEIDKHLENLPQLLQQARAVPDVGPDGTVRCYRLVDIKPGSMYEEIGLRRGDCILRVNSEEVTSPQKAMEMYQALKNGTEITITVDRGGSEVDFNYTIN